MTKIEITKEQARLFLLLKHGLIGEYKFCCEAGVLQYVKQVGCVQYDPIDVCGKNSELVFQSRVKGFSKAMLEKILYEKRQLVDYFDKNMAIILADDWKYFKRLREHHQINGRGKAEVDQIESSIKEIIKEKGYVAAKDLPYQEKVSWYWSATSLARAALETMYFRGSLIIHHKKGTNKYYGVTEDYLPDDVINAVDPNKTEYDYLKWRVFRRIKGVMICWQMVKLLKLILKD